MQCARRRCESAQSRPVPCPLCKASPAAGREAEGEPGAGLLGPVHRVGVRARHIFVGDEDTPQEIQKHTHTVCSNTKISLARETWQASRSICRICVHTRIPMITRCAGNNPISAKSRESLLQASRSRSVVIAVWRGAGLTGKITRMKLDESWPGHFDFFSGVICDLG